MLTTVGLTESEIRRPMMGILMAEIRWVPNLQSCCPSSVSSLAVILNGLTERS